MKKWKLKIYTVLFCVVCALSGCTAKNQMYLQAKEQENQAEDANFDRDAEDVTLAGSTQVDDTSKGMQPQEPKAADTERGEPQTSGAQRQQSQAAGEQTKDAQANGMQENCFVYICGAVKKPGVFEVPAGSRIYEVIMLAGGLKKNASVRGLNQAQQVADGDMIEVLTKKEQRTAQKDDKGLAGQSVLETDGTLQADVGAVGRVNLNTASAAELMTLNGIGEAKAANIIAYRQETGGFSSTQEIMNVNGIGEGVYAQIKDTITVE